MPATETTETRPRSLQIASGLLLTVPIVEIVFAIFMHRSALVFWPDRTLMMAACVAGAGLGLWVFLLFDKHMAEPKGFREAMGRFLFPVITLLAAWYSAMLSYEYAHFAAADTTTKAVTVEVTDLNRPNYFGHTANFILDGRSRSVRADITRDLYYRLDPNRHPGRDCLRVTVETGRNGVERYLLPARVLDPGLGAESWVDCSNPSNRVLPPSRN